MHWSNSMLYSILKLILGFHVCVLYTVLSMYKPLCCVLRRNRAIYIYFRKLHRLQHITKSEVSKSRIYFLGSSERLLIINLYVAPKGVRFLDNWIVSSQWCNSQDEKYFQCSALWSIFNITNLASFHTYWTLYLHNFLAITLREHMFFQ